MEISVENEKNEDYLNLFHKGDVILYKDHYCLITDIDGDDNAFLLRINSFDGFELRNTRMLLKNLFIIMSLEISIHQLD